MRCVDCTASPYYVSQMDDSLTLIHSHSPEGPPSVCGVGGDSEVPVKFGCDSFRLYNIEASAGGCCELLFNPQHIM